MVNHRREERSNDRLAGGSFRSPIPLVLLWLGKESRGLGANMSDRTPQKRGGGGRRSRDNKQERRGRIGARR